MPFSQSTITGVTISRDGPDLLIEWTTTSPPGTFYQLYVGGKLASSTQRTYAHASPPHAFAQIEVGAVGSYAERLTDFSASLPAPALTRAVLTWQGGTYLDASGGDDVAGFRVFASAAPGGAVSYATPVATVPAYSGPVADGFGLGGFGQGGFGRSAASYRWASGRLAAGVWRFGVAAYDRAGNQAGAPSEVAVTVAAPPRAPGSFPDGTRLAAAYDPAGHTATLTWNGSPL